MIISLALLQDDWTALHFAAQSDSADVVNHLIKCGAQIDARDTCWMTPLHIASGCGKLKSAEALLKSKAYTNLTTKGMLLPADLARDNASMLKLLSTYGSRNL